MKKEKCSWCGQIIRPGQGAMSNGKNYHTGCLTTRNVAGKAQRMETDEEANRPYEPTVVLLETQRESDELLIKTVNFNWKEAARLSRVRILAKYGNGLNK